jgi:hypothetical protein
VVFLEILFLSQKFPGTIFIDTSLIPIQPSIIADWPLMRYMYCDYMIGPGLKKNFSAISVLNSIMLSIPIKIPQSFVYDF